MSMLGRAFAGLGAGVSSIASKYIDEEMAANRAKLLADLQATTADRIARDGERRETEFAPAREAREAGMIRMRIGATNDATVANELANANNPTLQETRKRGKDAESEADTERERKRIESLTPAQVEAERKKAQAEADVQTQALRDRLPMEVQRAYATADAQGRASAKYRERPQTVQDKVEAIEQTIGRKLTEPEKMAVVGLAKTSAAVTEERVDEFDETGKKIGSKVTTKGPAGSIKAETSAVDVPAAAVDYLRKNPNLAADFDAKYGKGAAAKVMAGAPAPAPKPATKPMINVPTPAQPPALGAIDQGIYADLEPLAQQYQQAKAQLQAAGKSGDGQAISRATQAVNAAAAALRQEAEGRLGNGAQRFLAGVL
jgi:hypothetical protein